MSSADKPNRGGIFERILRSAVYGAAPIARMAAAGGHPRIPPRELMWAFAATAVWAIAVGAFFALAKARRRTIARERIQSVKTTRYFDLTRKTSTPASDPDAEQ